MSEHRQQNNQTVRPASGKRGGHMGGPPGMMPVQKAKDFKGTLKRLIRYLKPHRINLIIVFIFTIFSTIFTIAAPKVNSKAMNSLQDSYMARTMLKTLSQMQRETTQMIRREMSEAQQGL